MLQPLYLLQFIHGFMLKVEVQSVLKKRLSSTVYDLISSLHVHKTFFKNSIPSFENCVDLFQMAPLKYGPHCEKTCLRRITNNKGPDQPAHPHVFIHILCKYS